MPDKSISDGWYLLAAVLIVLVLCASIVSYYYKHKILLWRKSYNDRIHLMDEIEPTDFCEISLRHSSDESARFKSLEDIMEFDE